jgi:hypothetical protein
MGQPAESIEVESVLRGPFVLSGRVEKPDPSTTPIRGDLAHIALAGQYFVPHYVVPLQRMICDTGAILHSGANATSDPIDQLAPGVRFDLLDIEGDWAWGCVPQNGTVGYVRADELLDPFA